ncbi:MAG: hypothetical protein ACOYYF_00400 [Chloroflexota bacterium]|jgi:hypothetical protein
MARVVIYLLEPEMNALQRLAQQEYRAVKAQAALIIRNELKRLGMIMDQPAGNAADPKKLSKLNSGGAHDRAGS